MRGNVSEGVQATIMRVATLASLAGHDKKGEPPSDTADIGEDEQQV
jgi:hypothetical protein